jgi:nitroimidazol reductase NimA-like FMN-containing flavoprotein (pyridoxamine 5'-phosphate oxidase superfamily)
MLQDHDPPPLNQIRYTPKIVDDEFWIKSFLHRADFGALATSYDDQPFINTNLFVYDEDRHCLYLHTAQVGRTRTNVERNPRVCFSVSGMGRLLPANEALEFSVEYAGVTVFGTAHIVEDPVEAEHGLQHLLDKYAPHLEPGVDYRPITAEELARTSVYRVDIDAWSGKRGRAAADFPGAFRYEAFSAEDNPIAKGGVNE